MFVRVSFFEADWRRRRERCAGRMERSVRLPQNADLEAAKCCNKDGVLTVCVPKRGGTLGAPVKLRIN